MSILHQYENNWIIETDTKNNNFISSVNKFIDENLNKFICDRENKSTMGEKSKQYFIHDFNINSFSENTDFKNIINVVGNKVSESLYSSCILKKNYKLIFKNCWAVDGRGGGYHALHNHGHNPFGISTVLYTKVPNLNKVFRKFEESSGYAYFILNANFSSDLYNHSENVINICPEEGKLLIFPNWILHGTYPQTNELRRSLNINFELIKIG